MAARTARDYASAALCTKTPMQVARRFRYLLKQGCRLRPQGDARSEPESLLRRGYGPRYALSLFNLNVYLSEARQNTDIRFIVAFVQSKDKMRDIYPRLFYKDVSLTWRSASHFIHSEGENWIGKGDVKVRVVDGVEQVESDEATTDLPLEMQSAVEQVNRSASAVRFDKRAVSLVLRRGHDRRIQAYDDFTRPRRKAASNPANLVYRGRTVARFVRQNDPTSLQIVKGYEPNFRTGIVERAELTSSLYGGLLTRYRILSENRKIQYLFVAGPAQCWIASVQATSTELSTYGLRVVDAVVDDLLLLPGYEFHYLDESIEPAQWYSQIPSGYVGKASDVDPSRADASAWLNRVPLIRQFKKTVVRTRGRKIA